MTAKEKDRISIIEDKMDARAKRMDALDQRLVELNKQIDRVLFYLENDNSTDSKGFIARLARVENGVNNIIKSQEIFKGKATVWGIVGGAIISGAWFLIKLILTKLSII